MSDVAFIALTIVVFAVLALAVRGVERLVGPNNVIMMVVFVLVALAVVSVVDIALRHTRRAARASAEALTLSVLAGSVLRGQEAIPALLERARETFTMASATLLGHLERVRPDNGASEDPQQWVTLGVAGDPPARCPAEADVTVFVGDSVVLALRGRVLPAADQRVLTAFGAHVAVALDRDRLAREAAQAKPAMAADRMRTALLAAAKVAVSTLRSPGLVWSAEDTAELLAAAEESLDRLTRLVENLLDMSRLQTGALSLHLQPVALDEIIPIALDGLRPEADPVLLERVIANLVANALRYSPPEHPPTLTASALADRVELRVVDRGPGVPEADWERIFAPFQRLGDRDNTTGLGLGLALSRGLVEAMGGSLSPEDTPGGGLTMVVSLPAHPAVPGDGPREAASAASAASAEIPA